MLILLERRRLKAPKWSSLDARGIRVTVGHAG